MYMDGIPWGTTSDGDLEVIARRLKIPLRAVLMKDEMPRRLQPGAYIFNLQDHDQPGSHWVAAWCDGRDVYYSDSYGVGPVAQLIAEVRRNGGRLWYTAAQMQSLTSKMCGWFALGFLHWMSQGASVERARAWQRMFTNVVGKLQSNDARIKRYIQKSASNT
jgi:hypothetical protein